MGKKDSAYMVVYRGDTVDYIRPGTWVFFQRLKEYGGGFWLGRTYHNVFILEFERPTSLREGILFIMQTKSVERNFPSFDDDFELT
ncbi:hypothetical protein [Serratia inhibens]|uniref:hypothetical protein n=1 Tax=Serratia inhibens TaxID=2338073 RepID=UPI003216A3B3